MEEERYTVSQAAELAGVKSYVLVLGGRIKPADRTQ